MQFSCSPQDADTEAGRPFTFEFYVRDGPRADGAAEGTHKGTEAGDTLRRVLLTLPPPGRTGVHKGMRKLLAAAGAVQEAEAVDQEPELPPGLPLTRFLPIAAERQRQVSGSDSGPAGRLARARTALRVGRGVLLSYAMEAPPERRAELAERLVAALDACPAGHLQQATVVVGHESGVDGLGQVLLDADAARLPGAWLERLRGVDAVAVAAARARTAERRQAEVLAAQRLAVDVVHASETGLVLSPEYAAFLARAVDAGPRSAAAPGGRAPPLAGVLLHVGGRSQDGWADADWPAGYGARLREGVLAVPASAPAASVWAFLDRWGQEAARERAAQRALEARSSEAAALVRRRLRLRALLRDEAVPHHRFVSCCSRLLQHAMLLTPVAEGLTLRVSTLNSVERDVINIAWDAESL